MCVDVNLFLAFLSLEHQLSRRRFSNIFDFCVLARSACQFGKSWRGNLKLAAAPPAASRFPLENVGHFGQKRKSSWAFGHILHVFGNLGVAFGQPGACERFVSFAAV